jgi:LysM repeat protein
MPAVLLAYAALPASARVAFGDHEVRKGETLSGVARRYGVSTQVLADANPGLGSRAILRIGQILHVPSDGGAASTSATSAGGSARVHAVSAGETLGGISNRYGTTVAQLRSWNGLGSSNRIQVGQRLQVSAGATGRVATLASSGGTSRVHVVARGETLSAIADRYKVNVRALQDANNLDSPNRIKVGQRLRLP